MTNVTPSIGLPEILVVVGALAGAAIYCWLAASYDSRHGRYHPIHRVVTISIGVTVMMLIPLPMLQKFAPVPLSGWIGKFMIAGSFLVATTFTSAICYRLGHVLADGPRSVPDANSNDTTEPVEETGNPYQPPNLP